MHVTWHLWGLLHEYPPLATTHIIHKPHSHVKASSQTHEYLLGTTQRVLWTLLQATILGHIRCQALGPGSPHLGQRVAFRGEKADNIETYLHLPKLGQVFQKVQLHTSLGLDGREN